MGDKHFDFQYKNECVSDCGHLVPEIVWGVKK